MTLYGWADFYYKSDHVGVTAECAHCGAVGWAKITMGADINSGAWYAHPGDRRENDRQNKVRQSAWESVMHLGWCALQRAANRAAESKQ